MTITLTYSRWISVGAALVIAAALSPAAAEEAVDDRDYQSADDYDLDLFAQPGPALLSLDVALRRASAPSTPKDFGYNFGNIAGPDGDQIGVAVSASPYWIGERSITLEEYRNETSALERIVARSEISLGGSYIDADGDHAWRFGAAAQTQLLDAQDHRYDRAAFECLHEAWESLRRPAHERTASTLAEALAENPDLSDEELLRLQEEMLAGSAGESAFEAARRNCQDAGAARLLGKASWLVGAGIGMRSDQNRFGGFDYDGASAWTAYRQPLTGSGRYAVFTMARGDWDRAFDIGLAQPERANAYEAGGGVALQSTRFRLDLSASYNHRDYRTVADDDFIRYAAVADLRVLRGVWLEGAIGYVDQSLFSDGLFGGVAVKFDFGEVRRYF